MNDKKAFPMDKAYRGFARYILGDDTYGNEYASDDEER